MADVGRLSGYDAYHHWIDVARERAAEMGVADRVTFDIASPTDFPGRQYDLVFCFDCLRAVENPDGAARRVKDALASGGTWMIVEPLDADRETRLRRIAADAGFARFRRVTSIPFELVLEAQVEARNREPS
jgi:2-polyprenyl-3-methyl-5-hydroxy-6-metoxy-1,4-benzoquinol methylase